MIDPLDKPYIFDTLTEKNLIKTYRWMIDNNKFFSSEIKQVPSIQFNRIKFNRMDGRQQEEYNKKLNTLKTEYRLFYEDHNTFLVVHKKVYEYFIMKKGGELWR